MRRRASFVHEWLVRRADTSTGRLGVEWVRAYLRASHNSASAATILLFLSVAPLALAATGLLHAAGGNANVIAKELIQRQQLTGDTARLVRATFGTAAHNALATSAWALVGFLVWGIGIGRIYQDVYARAWRIQVRRFADRARFTIWFVAVSGLLGLFFALAEALTRSAWEAAILIYLVVSTAFWLWTPHYLLHGKIALRLLFPGALVATLVLGGATATSPIFLGSWLNSYVGYFGSFGVVIALIAWGFILSTISIASAVFSPVWREWRESERHAQPQVEGAPPGAERS